MQKLYDIDFLIQRAEEKISKKKPKRQIIPKPIVVIKNKFTYFSNLEEIAESLNRPGEQFRQFIDSEFHVTGNYDQYGALVINGIFREDKFKECIKNFAARYTTCEMCRSPFTILEKDEKTNLMYKLCNTCNAKKYY